MLLVMSTLILQPTLSLPSLFSDGMVLQREMPIPVFGRATPGATVEVTLAGSSVAGTADQDGKWLVKLPAMPAGGPLELRVKGPQERTIRNVMIGEVWVCSGQSNMEWPVNAADDPERDRREANRNVRMFTVAKASTIEMAEDAVGQWVTATPETVGTFSAVGYAFGKKIQETLHVPVGLIHTSWGGTPAQSWTSRQALAADPELRHYVQSLDRAMADYPAARQEWEKQLNAWMEKVFLKDPGNFGEASRWHLPVTEVGDWQLFDVPFVFDQGVDGAMWFRRDVELPADWSGQDLTLELGLIDDFDVTYWNGERVGSLGPDHPNAYSALRNYPVPGRLAKAGRNVLAVRIFDHFGNGGFFGGPEALRLVNNATGRTIPLAGKWHVNAEFLEPGASTEALNQRPPEPMGPGNAWAPTGLYNAMIAPLAPYAIRGAIWYQGESNTGAAVEYRNLFRTMIRDWRRTWGQGDFPFYFVQLANFMARHDQPTDPNWAWLREAQRMALEEPNTGMAVTIDIGDADDIHPRNKREVGRRLALHALVETYGRSMPRFGPVPFALDFNDGRAKVFFEHVVDGLRTSDGGKPVGFAIAGEDRRFHWAEARIVGTDVVELTSPAVPKPVAVRYAWADNPAANLTDSVGLPAGPFRTDSWPQR